MIREAAALLREKTRRLSHPLITDRHIELSILIYVRQSSPEQVRDHWGSTSLQEDQTQLALDYGWGPEQIIVVNEDLGKSGSTTVGRSGWQQMLDLMPTGTVGAVMALNVSRLARQLGDFEELRVLAKYHRVVLILDRRPVDPADPNDTWYLQMEASRAQRDQAARTTHLRDSRRAKAKAGATVSQLPIGWVVQADGLFDFDPEVKAAIDEVYVIFRRVRTLRGTVKELHRLGRKLPTRWRGDRIEWKRPSVPMVRRLVTNPAYAGVYLYGKSDSRPEYGPDSHSKPRRRRLPESEWIRHEGHHPAYITLEEQQTFLGWLRANRWEQRHRPNRGAALGQGLLQCAECGAALTVAYARRGSNRYQCTGGSAHYATSPCFSITGPELDAAVERAFLQRLGNPLEAVWQAGLAELRNAEQTRSSQVDAERQRLEHVERIARDRYEQVDARNRLVAARVEREYNDAIAAVRDFERRLALEPAGLRLDAMEREFAALHRSIQDIPSLWRHPTVTDRERKQMLQCLVDRVVVRRTEVAIEATIHWVDGTTSALKLWHFQGVCELVRQFHAEGMTAKQIRDRLAAGDPETNQSWDYTMVYIYQILRKLGLVPNSAKTAMKKLQAEIDALYDRGFSVPQIVRHLNDAGHRTSRGKPWTRNAVWYWTSRRDRRAELQDVHLQLLEDAKRRGLTNAQTADEFNRLGIARPGGRHWTADTVRQRRKHVRRVARRRPQTS